MTVSQLIKELEKQDQNMEVKVLYDAINELHPIDEVRVNTSYIIQPVKIEKTCVAIMIDSK